MFYPTAMLVVGVCAPTSSYWGEIGNYWEVDEKLHMWWAEGVRGVDGKR